MSHDRGCSCGKESYEYDDCKKEDCWKRSTQPKGSPFPPKPIDQLKALAYPDNNPKTAIGQSKPGFEAIPPVALIELGKAMANGKEKYGLMNWRDKNVSASVYYNAMLRHLFAWYDGENYSSDTVAAGKPVHHLGHVMACCAILLDAESLGKLNDDRPSNKGAFSAEIERSTQAA